MKVLFICNQNRHRSKTAEYLFKQQFETRSAGLYNDVLVMEAHLAWADIVAVMDDDPRAELGRRFPRQYLQKRIVSLGIPDTYSFNRPELIALLQNRVAELL
jgi:predicted protein tyrosine phosphatase